MKTLIYLIARLIKSLPHGGRLVGAAVSLLFALSLSAQTLIPIAPAYSQTSVNTAIFRNNSVVTHGKWQFASYYDADGYLTLAKRKLNSETWEIKRSQYKGNVKDGHNVISMMVDGKGYLHVAFDHHGHPLRYCRSIAPLSLELGEKEAMTGVDEGNVTYPEFYLLKGGDLLFAYRSGASGNGNLVMNRYSVKTRKWTRIQDVLIDGEGKRNAYWQLFVDKEGTIHVSWVWRETWHVETNHDLCYACSKDGGKTWQKSNGEQYSLPITAANAEYAWRIPQNSELINQTSMIATDGHPYIATYWRSGDSKVPQYRLVWHDGTEWRMRQVSNRQTPFSLSGGGTKMIPIARPRLAIDGKKAYYIFRDQERGSKVSLYTTNDLTNGEWQVKDLTNFSVDAWEPSFDTELWKNEHKLHIFVETTHQGDGEQTVVAKPEIAYILEVATNASAGNVVVDVENTLNTQRRELIEININEVYKKLNIDSCTSLVVRNALKQEVAYQITHDGKLLIVASVSPNGKATFTISPGSPATFTSYVYGQVWRERLDDLTWENDCAIYRMYGPSLQRTGERSFGTDIWTKSIPQLDVVKRYKEGSTKSYHLDHGTGLDAYGVGPTLGCGAPALMDNGKLVMPYCWQTCDILDNGPLRFTVMLTYGKSVVGGDRNVVEHRLVSLDKGSHYNRMTVWYDGLTATRPLATGVVVHDADTTSIKLGNDCALYADPTDRPQQLNQQVYVGTVYPYSDVNSLFLPISETVKGVAGHAVGITDYVPGSRFTYFFGSAWSGYDIRSWEEWQLHSRLFIESQRHPLVVTIH